MESFGSAAKVQRWLVLDHSQSDRNGCVVRTSLPSPVNATPFCRSHPRLVPMNAQSGIVCDPASLVLYGRCQASSRPHARSRKGESRRTLSEPLSPFESKPCIIHTCKEYRGAKLHSARCCSSRCAQKEDKKCNLRNPKSRSRLSKWSSAGASSESAVSSSNLLIVIRCANGIQSILDSLTKAEARCFRGANTTNRKRNTLQL